MKRIVLVLALSSLLASTTRSQQGVTPSDGSAAPTLQEAIYAASPGDTLYADQHFPQIKGHIRVDRPLTLVGGTYYSIEFAGPGHGRAYLIEANVVREPDDPFNQHTHAGISVSGFDF